MKRFTKDDHFMFWGGVGWIGGITTLISMIAVFGNGYPYEKGLLVVAIPVALWVTGCLLYALTRPES